MGLRPAKPHEKRWGMLTGSRDLVLLSIRFFARRDDSCGGTSSQHRSVAFQAAMPPFVGAFFLRAAALLRPGDRPRHRTLSDVPFAACRYAGQAGNLRRIVNPPAGPFGRGRQNVLRSARPIANRPQINNLPHKGCVVSAYFTIPFSNFSYASVTASQE